jgi:uncharacterized glyoxalase superfamily protein PhnB
MPRLVPCLTVREVEPALDFYRRAFGFEPNERTLLRSPDGRIVYADMRFGEDAVVMLGPEGAFGNPCKSPATMGAPPPVGLYIYCDDVDALFRQATKAGAASRCDPQDMFWGDRMCQLADPDGYLWSFATNVGDFDPSKIPPPGECG